MNAKRSVLRVGILVMAFGAVAVYAQEAEAPAAAPEHEDFSSDLRFGTWALNAFVMPGLGSFVLMQDEIGGAVQLMAGSAGLFYTIGGAVLVTSLSNGSGGWGAGYLGYALLIGGIGSMVFAQAYNIFRSATYHKPLPATAEALLDPEAWSLEVLPTADGRIDKVQLSYTLKF